MGIDRGGFPLIFDGMNEYGVCIAGLNFKTSARFFAARSGRVNLASHEIIPYVLAMAKSALEAKNILTRVNITADKFNTDTDIATLHFMVADKKSSFIAEQTEMGMSVYEDRFGTLTNEPTYPLQLLLACRIPSINNGKRASDFPCADLLSFGEGALGLPGDPSSPSRFARAAFGVRFGCAKDKKEALATAARILESVSVIRGSVSEGGEDYKTRYLSVMDINDFKYYYRRYQDLEFACASPSDTEGLTILK